MTTDVTVDVLELFVALAMAVAAGLMGCFAVMRRLSLAADALSHIALPGIGIAIALHIHPILGAGAMLAFGALLVWALEEATRARTETIIGVIFSAALAVGGMMTKGEDLIEALFGGGGVMPVGEAIFGLVAAVAVVWFIVRWKHELVVSLVSPDIARTAGVAVRRLNLLYLLMFSLTIALGLRYLGVLLMGSLVIIPAATAMRLSTNLASMLAMSAVLAAGATALGFVLGGVLHRDAGPLIVSIAAGMFLVSLLRRR